MSKASKILEELNEEASIKWKKHCDLYHPYNRARYIAWEATSDGKKIYQILPTDSTPQSDGGYYNLESAMKLKGLKKVQKHS